MGTSGAVLVRRRQIDQCRRWAPSRRGVQLADLELRHRRRARCADRSIRCAKDTGPRNLPLQGFTQNQIWCQLVAMACELLARMQMLALDGPPAAGNPNACGCPFLRRRAHRPRRRRAALRPPLRPPLAAAWPWATQITTAITRLQALAPG